MAKKAKPIEANVEKKIKAFVKDRDEAIESKDPNKFMEFADKHKHEFEDGIYKELHFKHLFLGDDFILLIMAKMSEQCTKISKETKAWYKNWLEEWRRKREQ